MILFMEFYIILTIYRSCDSESASGWAATLGKKQDVWNEVED